MKQGVSTQVIGKSFGHTIYILSFVTSESFIMIILRPLHGDRFKALWSCGPVDGCMLHGSIGANLIVISQHDNDVITICLYAIFFSFHKINAF